MFQLDDALRDRITSNLDGHDRRTIDHGDRKRAAVAIVVVASDAGAGFVLCRRAARMNRHSFQWARPGGRLDPGETAVDAARRELHEELAVELGPETVLGLLDDYPTRSGYVITPVVLWGGGPLEMIPSPD